LGVKNLLVHRGGGWVHFAKFCRSVVILYGKPGQQYDYLGLRGSLVRADK